MKQGYKFARYAKWIIPIYLITIMFAFLSGCNKFDSGIQDEIFDTLKIEKKAVMNEEIAVEPPPFSDDIFPCTDCHAFQEPNPTRRELIEWHDEIIFSHDSENRWCLDCHDMNSRDSLKLASGKLLDFKQSYKLCGQCHGNKLRDWKVGVHGKRTGEWNGKKEYLLCVHCHNPHSPKFKKLTPEPPPMRQEEIK